MSQLGSTVGGVMVQQFEGTQRKVMLSPPERVSGEGDGHSSVDTHRSRQMAQLECPVCLRVNFPFRFSCDVHTRFRASTGYQW